MPDSEQTRMDMHGHDQPRPDTPAEPQSTHQLGQQPVAPAAENEPALPQSTQLPEHAQSRIDASIGDQARPDTQMPPPANWITIENALPRFAAAGAPRKLRTVQKYCGNGKLRCHLAMTEVGFKYYVDPSSIDELLAREAQMAPLGGTHDDERGETPEHAQPRPDAPADARARTDAPVPAAADVYEHPYVRKLEARIDRLEEKYEAQVRRTEEIQNQARAELIELQKANAIGQSQTLAEYLLKAREYVLGDAQVDQPPQNTDGQ